MSKRRRLSQDDLVVHNLYHRRMYFWWFDNKDEIRDILLKQDFQDAFLNDFLDWINEAYTVYRADSLLYDYLRRELQTEMKRRGNPYLIGENNIRTKSRRACRLRKRELLALRERQQQIKERKK